MCSKGRQVIPGVPPGQQGRLSCPLIGAVRLGTAHVIAECPAVLTLPGGGINRPPLINFDWQAELDGLLIGEVID